MNNVRTAARYIAIILGLVLFAHVFARVVLMEGSEDATISLFDIHASVAQWTSAHFLALIAISFAGAIFFSGEKVATHGPRT